MAIAELFVNVNANMDNFSRGMGEVQNKLSVVGSSMTSAGATLTKGLTVPITAAGASLLAITSKFASAGDHIAKTSQKLGITTDAYQELEYAMGQVGVSQGTMERGIGRLNQRMGRAIEGNEKYQEALASVGISQQDLEQGVYSTDEAFVKILKSLHEVEDSQLQSAMASEIFGTKMGRDLMPAIKAGGEEIDALRGRAHELGLVMGEDAVQGSEAYSDAMDDLTRSFKAVWMQIATEFMPIMTESLIPMIQETVIPMIEKFASFLGGLLKVFGQLPQPVQGAILIFAGLLAALGPVLLIVGTLINSIAGMVPVITKAIAIVKKLGLIMGGAAAGPIMLKIAAIGAVIAIIVLVIKNFDKLAKVAKIVWEEMVKLVKRVWEGIKNATVEIWDSITKFITNIWDKLKDIFIKSFEFVKNLFLKYNPISIIISQWDKIIEFFKGIPNLIKNAFSRVTEALVSPFKKAREQIGKVTDGIRNALNKINPFSRNSPSLVDYVQMGAKEIEDSYNSISIDQSPVAEMGAAEINVNGKMGANDIGFIVADNRVLKELQRKLKGQENREIARGAI